MMKAAIVHGAHQLVVRDVPEPGALGDYDVLCELLYGATCTGTDSHIIACQFPWIGKLPTILGHESCGRAVKLGAKVRHVRVGDLLTRVGAPPVGEYSVTWGGFAQWGVARDHWAMAADGLPASQWGGYTQNQVVPAGIDARVAPMYTTWRETLSYIQRRGNWSGKHVLIVGSGGNGLSFLAHAVNLGAGFVAMAGSERLRDTATRRLGAHLYVDYRSTDPAGTLNAAAPTGYDLVIDALGKAGVPDQFLPCVADGGLYAAYGIDDFQKVSLNPTRARGDWRFHNHGGYDEAETHGQVSDFIRLGKLDASVWYDLDGAYPLDAINDAFTAALGRQTPKSLVRLSNG